MPKKKTVGVVPRCADAQDPELLRHRYCITLRHAAPVVAPDLRWMLSEQLAACVARDPMAAPSVADEESGADIERGVQPGDHGAV